MRMMLQIVLASAMLAFTAVGGFAQETKDKSKSCGEKCADKCTKKCAGKCRTGCKAGACKTCPTTTASKVATKCGAACAGAAEACKCGKDCQCGNVATAVKREDCKCGEDCRCGSKAIALRHGAVCPFALYRKLIETQAENTILKARVEMQNDFIAWTQEFHKQMLKKETEIAHLHAKLELVQKQAASTSKIAATQAENAKLVRRTAELERQLESLHVRLAERRSATQPK